MQVLKNLAAAAIATTIALPVFAGVATPTPPPATPTVSGTNDETTAFAGINLVFGSGKRHLEGFVGVIYSQTDSSGDVTGAKGTLNFPFDGESGINARVTGLVGGTDVQGEAGLGFNFGTGSPFGILGLNGPYSQVGMQFWPGSDVEGYVGLHSQGSFSAPAAGGGAPSPSVEPPGDQPGDEPGVAIVQRPIPLN